MHDDDGALLLARRLLDHAHRISAIRNGRAGHDPHRLAGTDPPRRHLTGRDRADDPQTRFAANGVRAAECVPVHLRVREKRHGPGRDDGPG